MKSNFIITLATLLIMSGVTYLSLITTDTTKKVKVDKANVLKNTVNVEGMTCEPCEVTIEKFALDVDGVTSVKASLENKNAIIEFDKTQTDIQTIMKAINLAGYKTISYEDETGGVHQVNQIIVKEQGSEESVKKSEDMKCGSSMKCGAGKCGKAN